MGGAPPQYLTLVSCCVQVYIYMGSLCVHRLLELCGNRSPLDPWTPLTPVTHSPRHVATRATCHRHGRPPGAGACPRPPVNAAVVQPRRPWRRCRRGRAWLYVRVWQDGGRRGQVRMEPQRCSDGCAPPSLGRGIGTAQLHNFVSPPVDCMVLGRSRRPCCWTPTAWLGLRARPAFVRPKLLLWNRRTPW